MIFQLFGLQLFRYSDFSEFEVIEDLQAIGVD